MATIQFFNSLFIRDGPFRLFWEDAGATCIKEYLYDLYLWFHDRRFMPDGVLMGYTKKGSLVLVLIDVTRFDASR